jgi:hypothetical protein
MLKTRNLGEIWESGVVAMESGFFLANRLINHVNSLSQSLKAPLT